MGIRFYCPNGHRLNVKTELAGKRGYCPHCNVKVLIPTVSEIDQPKSDLPDPLRERPTPSLSAASARRRFRGEVDLWYVRPPSGGQFGPVNTEALNQWIAENRVPPDSQLLREGLSEWRRASSLMNDMGLIDHHRSSESTESALIEIQSEPIVEQKVLKTHSGTIRKRRVNRVKLAVILGLLALALLGVWVAILLSHARTA